MSEEAARFSAVIWEQALPTPARDTGLFRLRAIGAVIAALFDGGVFTPEAPAPPRRYAVALTDDRRRDPLARSAWTDDYLAAERLRNQWTALVADVDPDEVIALAPRLEGATAK